MFFQESVTLSNKYPSLIQIIEKIDETLSSQNSSDLFQIDVIASVLNEKTSDVSLIFEKLFQLGLLTKENYIKCSKCGNLIKNEYYEEAFVWEGFVECSQCENHINDPEEKKVCYRLIKEKIPKKVEKDRDISQNSTEKDIFFGIVTALPIELDAVLEHFEFEKVKKEFRSYYVGDFCSEVNSNCYSIVAVQSLYAGNTPSAIVTKDLIHDWNPKYIIMIGIAGGYHEDELNLGDVVIADQIFDYDYTKEYEGFSQKRPRIGHSDRYLLQCVTNFRWKLPILNIDCPDGSENTPKYVISNIATGNKVIASNEMKERIKEHHGKITAIEMEAGGVVEAAGQLKSPVGILIIRGISDFGDEDKDDNWHEYSAKSAAKFFFDFLKKTDV